MPDALIVYCNSINQSISILYLPSYLQYEPSSVCHQCYRRSSHVIPEVVGVGNLVALVYPDMGVFIVQCMVHLEAPEDGMYTK